MLVPGVAAEVRSHCNYTAHGSAGRLIKRIPAGVLSARPTQPGPAGGGTAILLQGAPRGRRFKFAEGFELLLQRAAGTHPAAPQLHHQGGCGFKTLSELTRRRSATPQDFILNNPPPPKTGDSPVSNGDISFPNYSGSSWLRKARGCGERGGGREEPDCEGKTPRSLPPHRYVAFKFQNRAIWDMLANSTGGKQ